MKEKSRVLDIVELSKRFCWPESMLDSFVKVIDPGHAIRETCSELPTPEVIFLVGRLLSLTVEKGWPAPFVTCDVDGGIGLSYTGISRFFIEICNNGFHGFLPAKNDGIINFRSRSPEKIIKRITESRGFCGF